MISNVNKKLEKDLNFKGSPKNRLRGQGLRRSTEKNKGGNSSMRKKTGDGKFDVIKGKKFFCKIN